MSITDFRQHEIDKKAFFQGVREGNLETVKFYIETDLKMRKKLPTCVRLASQEGKLEILKYIEEQVKKQSKHTKSSSLVESCRYGHLDVAKYLVKNGADVHHEKDSPIQEAISSGYLDIVKFLVENGVEVKGNNNICIKKAKIDLDLIKYLHQLGASIDSIDFSNACKEGDSEVVKYILQNIKLDNKALIDGIFCAANYHKHDIIIFLIENGFVELDQASGNYLFGYTRIPKDYSFIGYLLRKGYIPVNRSSEIQKYFRLISTFFKRWRRAILVRRLTREILPIYYSPGFPGWFKGRESLENFVGEMEGGKE